MRDEMCATCFPYSGSKSGVLGWGKVWSGLGSAAACPTLSFLPLRGARRSPTTLWRQATRVWVGVARCVRWTGEIAGVMRRAEAMVW